MRALLAALAMAWPLAALAGAQELFDAGDFAEAEAAAKHELKARPDDLTALLVLGRTQLTLDHPADAVRTLRAAAQQHPDSAEAYYRLGQAITLRVAEMSSWRRMFLADDIGEAFRRAVELAPDNAEYRWAHFEFCRQAPAMVGGGSKNARAEAAALARLDPARGYRAEAAFLLQDGRLEEAEHALRAAIDQAPAVADHRFALGYFYLQLERWDEAFAIFTEITERFRAEAQAWFQIGRTAAMSGQRLDVGERALQRYLQYKPKSGEPPLAWAHYRLGLIHEHRRDAAAAAAAYEAALKLDPRLTDARTALTALKRR
jgi:tetratricopeptide (TPR) repeat protein